MNRLSDKEWSRLRKSIFTSVEKSTEGHYFYRQVYDELVDLSRVGNEDRVHQLAIELLRRFSNRPALIWQFEQLLSTEDKAEYEAWKKQAKPKTSICSQCGSTKILPIVYGMPDYSLFRQEEQGRVILGGCEVYDDAPKYQCAKCGKEYTKKPLPQTVS